MSDPRPVTATYAYDGADRLTGISAPTLTAITMSYDVGGRRLSLSDETGTTSFTYDGLDRLTQATHSLTGTVTHGYDVLGRRTSLSTSTGLPAQGFVYDAAGRLTAVQRAGAAHADASYDAAGRLQQVARAGGLTTGFTYDGADRLTRLRTTSGSTTQADLTYTLTRAGQVSSVSETIGTTNRSVSYTYDGLLRLTGGSESPGDAYAYTYDLAGNRLTVTVNNRQTESRSYDAADQVVGWSYDAAGHLLDDGSQTYTYDPLDRLSSVTQGRRRPATSPPAMGTKPRAPVAARRATRWMGTSATT